MQKVAHGFSIAWIILSILASIVFICFGVECLTVYQGATDGAEAAAASITLVLSVIFFVIGGVFIIPIIVNGFGIALIPRLNNKKQYVILGIIILILGINPITAILLFCMNDDGPNEVRD